MGFFKFCIYVSWAKCGVYFNLSWLLSPPLFFCYFLKTGGGSLLIFRALGFDALVFHTTLLWSVEGGEKNYRAQQKEKIASLYNPAHGFLDTVLSLLFRYVKNVEYQQWVSVVYC